MTKEVSTPIKNTDSGSLLDPVCFSRTEVLTRVGNHCKAIGGRCHLKDTIKLCTSPYSLR